MCSLSFTDAYPSEEAVSKIIANSLSSLWYSSLRQLVEVQASRASWPSTIETPGWCRELKKIYLEWSYKPRYMRMATVSYKEGRNYKISNN